MEFDHIQEQAMNRIKSGSILVGGTGSGKSRTALAYFFTKECNGKFNVKNGYAELYFLNKQKPLYIITTAAKRDKHEWEKEIIPFGLEATIDSWNNISKYVNINDSFFIFDEQRVVGSGAWSKSFLEIAKTNHWILLSATPGDQWSDYIPVFIANGFYKNRTQFYTRHVIWSRYTTYPKIDRYLEEDHLEKLKSNILIEMEVKKITIPHRIFEQVEYDKTSYDNVNKTHWDIFKDQPIENASQYMTIIRKIVNKDVSRIEKIKEILKEHNKVIIFYNFDYERDVILNLCETENILVHEWNGHKHETLPNSEQWIYLVQYAAGSEGWECTKTDTIIFYSLSYSYRMTKQAEGRIDRRNTKFIDLYYYYLISNSIIDKEILKALKSKKNFNEKHFYDEVSQTGHENFYEKSESL